jgi:chitin disaccharide deacetylase
MSDARRLIVNADDFGLSPGVNRGIIQTYERGIVTSTSLMVRGETAGEAAEYAKLHPALGVGLHLDLGEWIYRDEAWVPLYEVCPDDDETEVEREATRQLDRFRELMGSDPTHIDSHQHVHQRMPTSGIVKRLARTLGVQVRHFSPTIRYFGGFYGQSGKGEPYHDAITPQTLIGVLEALPTGVTELGCHPGLGTDVETMYASERAIEVDTLCDPRVRASIDNFGIRLCSFRDFIGS